MRRREIHSYKPKLDDTTNIRCLLKVSNRFSPGRGAPRTNSTSSSNDGRSLLQQEEKKRNWTMRSSKQCCDTVSLQINHTIWNNIPQRMRKCACRFTKERLFKSTFTRGAMQKRNYLPKCHLCCQKLKKAASNGTIVITASYILQISQNIYVLEWIEKKTMTEWTNCSSTRLYIPCWVFVIS